jgi:hypothetical protein
MIWVRNIVGEKGMNYEQKLMHYATAPRATAGQIWNYIDGSFVRSWAGRLRGAYVKMDGEWLFKTKPEAVALAKRYRQSCLDEAKSKGLIVEVGE